ncbi:cyclic nucleotide-binding domain-containing protein [Flavobacterium sp.]|uniref:Crp/Fnr family transcriptional regulator n=1 Tax=Flavobacterium sp. TaxID=239 RepID=UPI00261F86A1|nr:cyclic nucleotide-binding domain-containing protein [Flavobacterium sp.]
MKEFLEAHIRKRLGENPENLDFVLDHFEPVTVAKNEMILKSGKTCNHIYFIVSGCLQVFVYDDDMNENIRDLIIEDNWCSELHSFTTGNPANENIKAIEPCQLLCISKSNFALLVQKVPQFNVAYQQILEQSYLNSVYRINTFVSMSALDRLKWLMQNRPYLLNRISSKTLASYLGINKDVFSRLKSKL